MLAKQSWWKIQAGTAALVAMVGLSLPVTHAYGFPLPVTRADSNASGEEAQFVARINAFRREHGLAALAVDAHLTSVARNWSAHNASAQQSSHNPNLASDVGTSNKLGENVGNGDNVDWLEGSFEQSPEHQRNLLDPDFRWVGVGVVDTQDVVWVTQDFEADAPAGDASQSQSQSSPPAEQPASPEPPAPPTQAPPPTAGWVHDGPAPTSAAAPRPSFVPPSAAAPRPSAELSDAPTAATTNPDAAAMLRNALATWTALTAS